MNDKTFEYSIYDIKNKILFEDVKYSIKQIDEVLNLIFEGKVKKGTFDNENILDIIEQSGEKLTDAQKKKLALYLVTPKKDLKTNTTINASVYDITSTILLENVNFSNEEIEQMLKPIFEDKTERGVLATNHILDIIEQSGEKLTDVQKKKLAMNLVTPKKNKKTEEIMYPSVSDITKTILLKDVNFSNEEIEQILKPIFENKAEKGAIATTHILNIIEQSGEKLTSVQKKKLAMNLVTPKKDKKTKTKTYCNVRDISRIILLENVKFTHQEIGQILKLIFEDKAEKGAIATTHILNIIEQSGKKLTIRQKIKLKNTLKSNNQNFKGKKTNNKKYSL